MYRPVSIALTLLLLGSLAFSQQTRCERADLRVKIVYSNSRSARNHTQVDLLTGSGLLITERFSDDNGNAEFLQLSVGNYRIRVTDSAVEENVSDVINLACGEAVRMEMITVKLKPGAQALEQQQQAKDAMISTLELNVPPEAKKEFEKGANAMAAGSLPEAQKHLERAIDLYPKYAMAYNHLGVVYMQTGQPQKGREAFEKAVALNDRYPSALVNLAKLRFQDRKLEEAETLLRKAEAAEPSNPETLALLCDAEIVNGRLDDGLGNLVKLHALPHKEFAALHYIAAQALAAKGRPDEAAAQYALYLQESPDGKGADKARKELARLKGQAVSR